MVPLLAAFATLLITALAVAASMRLVSSISFLLAAYLFAVSEVVLLTEALSLAHAVNAWGYAIGETVLCVAAVGAWHLRGRPLPSRPAVDWESLWRHPVVAALALVVGAAVYYQAFLVFSTPPSNWDSMTYHLARAAEWYQRQAVEYYPAHTARENAFQPNGEVLVLYTFAFLGRDTVAALPQLVAELASLTAVFGIARRLGFSRPASAFAALLTATLTLVALQSVTTQNDLLAASFIAAGLYFVLGGARKDLVLAGVAVGLALGTKATSVFGLPLIGLAAVIALDRRRLLQALGFALVGVALVGAYGYVLNVTETGHLLGDPSATELPRPEVTLSGTASTAARLAFRLVDLSGYNAFGYHLASDAGWIGSSAKWLFDVLHIPLNPPESTSMEFHFAANESSNEDWSYFGPLGALLVLPLGVGFLVAVIARRASLLHAVPALALPTYLLAIALAARYHAFLGRFLLAGVLVTMPLAAWVYRRRLLAAAVALVGALTLGLTHAHSMTKPTGVDHSPAVWSLDRPEAQTVLRPSMTQVIREVDRLVPADARMGFALGGDEWIYPFYGRRLERTLVRLPPDSLLAAADRARADWILTAGVVLVGNPGWEVIDLPIANWRLLRRTEQAES